MEKDLVLIDPQSRLPNKSEQQTSAAAGTTTRRPPIGDKVQPASLPLPTNPPTSQPLTQPASTANKQAPTQGNVLVANVMHTGTERRPGLPAFIDILTRATSLDELQELIPPQLAQYLGCRRVILYQVRGDELGMVGCTADAYSRGMSSTLLRIASIEPIRRDATRAEAQALRKGIVIFEPASDADTPARVVATVYGLGGPIGVIVIVPNDNDAAGSSEGGFASQALITSLEDTARVIGIILESAILLTDHDQHADVMDLLRQLTTAFNNSVLDLEAASGIVERQVRRITKMDPRLDFCTVALGPAPGAGQGNTDRWLHNDIYQIFQQTAIPLTLDETGAWQMMHLLPKGVRSFYAFPLIAEDSLVGVLALAFRGPHRITKSERALLTILANIASTVLQKERLHAHARQMLERAQTEERFKDAILRNVQSGLLTVDLDGRITHFNHHAAALLSLTESTAMHQRIEDVMPVLDSELHVVRSGLGDHKAQRRREVRIRTVAGQELMLDVAVVPIYQSDGKDLGALCAFTDVTKYRAMEGEMRRLVPIANLGNEAKEISHDMNNIIHNITWGLQTVLPTPLGDENDISLGLIHKELNRLTALAENIKNLSSPKEPKLEPLDAADMFESMLDRISHRLTMGNVAVERRFEPGVTLMADVYQVERVLENLCINAIEAMPQGGKLTITTRTTRSSMTFGPGKVSPPLIVRDPAAAKPGTPPTGGLGTNETELLMPDHRQRAVEIEISDTGIGIPEERLKDIWEPFKTFGKKQGTGLGLAIVRQLVEAHGGSISVTSKLNQGTTFIIRLPGTR